MNGTAGPALVFEHAVRMPRRWHHFWTSSLSTPQLKLPAQLETLPYVYESAPSNLDPRNCIFIMPTTKSTKTQRSSGVTVQTKDKSKSSKTTKVFTAIDISRLTPDQREMRRHRRTTERERAIRAHSDDGNDTDDSPAAAETTLAVTQQAPLDVAQRVGVRGDSAVGRLAPVAVAAGWRILRLQGARGKR